MTAVFKREFKAFFNNVIGWVFMAVILAVYGLYFFVYNLRGGYPYVAYTLSAMGFLLIIAVSFLTMRVMSEDRKSRTDQLILTAPVSLIKVVIGKFLAMAAIFTLDMLVISITPLVLALYGTVPMGESYTAILGFWLYGLTCIAIGEFASSLTESQILSAIICFVLLFFGYLMNSICSLISEGGNIITKILKCYDLYSRLGTFMAGTLDITSIVYFVTLIILVLFLTTQVVEKRRWTMSVKKLGMGAFSVITIVVAVAVCFGINWGVNKIPTEYTSLDVTNSKLFKLTEDTKTYVSKLENDVTIYAWVAENNADTTVKETLSRYEDLSSHLKVKYISPSDSPDFYKNYTDEEPSENTLFVVSDKRSKMIPYDDIYVYSYDYNTYSKTIDAYDAEGKITSAIEYVLMDDTEMATVYMLTNHGERELGSGFTQSMDKLNISVVNLDLLANDSVPDDCQLLIVNAPEKDLSADDKKKISDYMTAGGTVLLTVTYDSESQPNIESLLNDYGIELVKGVVMENDANRYYAGTPYFILPEVISNTYTAGIENGYAFAPYAAGMSLDISSDTYDYLDILGTSDKAVAKMNTETATTSDYEEGDVKGPFYLGVSAMKREEPGTLVVFSSIDIFTDEANEIVAGSNVKLFEGILGKHVSESDLDLPVIASKAYTVDNLVMNSMTGVLVGMVVMVLLPILFIVAGISIWAIRKKK